MQASTNCYVLKIHQKLAHTAGAIQHADRELIYTCNGVCMSKGCDKACIKSVVVVSPAAAPPDTGAEVKRLMLSKTPLTALTVKA